VPGLNQWINFRGRARRTSGQGAADRGEYRQAAGVVAEGLIAILLGYRMTDTAFGALSNLLEMLLEKALESGSDDE
jgi:hypothetical protein